MFAQQYVNFIANTILTTIEDYAFLINIMSCALAKLSLHQFVKLERFSLLQL